MIFIKTPNNKTNSGKLGDRYMINPDSKSNINKKAYEFIGKLMVMSFNWRSIKLKFTSNNMEKNIKKRISI